VSSLADGAGGSSPVRTSWSRQQVRHHRAQPAAGRGARRSSPVDRPSEQAAVEAIRRWRAGRDNAAVEQALTERPTPPRPRQPDGGHPRLRPRRGDHRRVAGALPGCSASNRAPTGVGMASAVASGARTGRRPRAGAGHRSELAPGCGCCRQPGLTGTPTAPSRSRCAPGTPARGHLPGLRSPRRRSWRAAAPPAGRACDVVGYPCCPARTLEVCRRWGRAGAAVPRTSR